MVTVASWIMAPVESFTAPKMVPEVTCASRGAHARHAIAAAIRAIMRLRLAMVTTLFWDGRDMGSLLGEFLSITWGRSIIRETFHITSVTPITSPLKKPL